MARPSDRDRYKYGICTNRDKGGEGAPCPKCESKEVQKVRAGQDFVCDECKEPLRMVPLPKEGLNMKLIGGIVAAVVVLGGAGIGFYLSGGEKTAVPVETPKDSIEAVHVVIEDDGAEAEEVTGLSQTETETEVVETESPATPVTHSTTNATRGTVKLSYGTYTGELKNGKPHGYGTVTYSTHWKIVSSKDFIAEPGDTFEGEFRDGKISGLGYWKHGGNTTAVKP